jgi:NADH-quinone oxidoreductase subunit C
MEEILNRLKSRYSIKDEKKTLPYQLFFTADKADLLSMLTLLKENEGFTHLVLLTAVDYIEQDLFQLTYIINNPDKKKEAAVRVMLDRNNPVMDSIHSLWITAATYQRELKEMFGIDFPGSPRVDEAFILEGWDDLPPYRRDFDTLKYVQEHHADRPGRLTYDPSQYMKEKLYPEG